MLRGVPWRCTESLPKCCIDNGLYALTLREKGRVFCVLRSYKIRSYFVSGVQKFFMIMTYI